MKNIIVILLLLLAVSACKPRFVGLASVPDGPPDFQDGWKDGCDTGIAEYSSSFYKTLYKFKQDPYRTTDETYYRAWLDAKNYCSIYGLRWANNAADELENIEKRY